MVTFCQDTVEPSLKNIQNEVAWGISACICAISAFAIIIMRVVQFNIEKLSQEIYSYYFNLYKEFIDLNKNIDGGTNSNS